MPNPNIPTSNSAKAGQRVVGVDASSLKSILVRSGIQKSDQAAFQTVNNLIEGVKSFQDFAQNALTGLNGAVNTLSQAVVDLKTYIDAQLLILAQQSVFVINVDTLSPPIPIDPTLYPIGFIIVKDTGGNAFVNNITILGNVDGAPVVPISTNYGIFRFYLEPLSGNFFSW